MKKKKWNETWWGFLWVLAIVDANPGRGLRVFMEVDEELKNLCRSSAMIVQLKSLLGLKKEQELIFARQGLQLTV